MNSTTQVLDVRAALKEAMRRLRAGNVPSHTLAAELLLLHVLGRDRAWLYAYPEETIAAEQVERYFELVARRIAGMPTQYLTGKQEFWGLEFEVTPDVLIPRPETEHVVEVTLERVGPPSWAEREARTAPGTGMRIGDVGTGSGCIAVALAHELPGAQIVATDISEAALVVARRNAARHGVADRIHFVQADLLEAVASSLATVRPTLTVPSESRGIHHSSLATSHWSLFFDLIVSNPPYVGRSETASLPGEVRDHEPQSALFAGEHGMEFYEPLTRQAEQLLRPGGSLVLELGHNSLDRVRPLLGSDCWTRVAVTHDLAGIPRVLAATRV